MKLREPGLSLVCYHCCRGWASVPFPFFSGFLRISLQQIVEPNSTPKRKGKGMPHFTEDNLQRIITNPFYAITVAPQLTVEHEPPMGEAEWVQANASLIREMGSERWLRQLLDVLGGDIVTAEEVGLAPPGGTFGYGAPGRSKPQRRGKKKREKRHHE